MALERVIRISHAGRVYTFRMERDGHLSFWRVDTDGQPTVHLPLFALGDELPEFFQSVVQKVADGTL